jgi:hypothetical protein
MKKNITLKVDERLLKLCRFEAVEADKSLSQWVADVLAERVRSLDEYEKAKSHAKMVLSRGSSLGGKPLTRDETHARS